MGSMLVRLAGYQIWMLFEREVGGGQHKGAFREVIEGLPMVDDEPSNSKQLGLELAVNQTLTQR